MNKKENIERKVEKTLASLDGMERTGPGPHFFTRLMTRLEPKPQNAWELAVSFIARPAFALSVLLFVLLLNGFVAFNSNNTSVASANETQEQGILDEYNTTIASTYDIENDEP